MSQLTLGSKAAGADGRATLSVRPNAQQTWRVTQVVVSNNGAALCNAFVTVNDLINCATKAGNQDTAAGEPAIMLSNAEELKITWTNATPGSMCSAVIYYENTTFDVRKT